MSTYGTEFTHADSDGDELWVNRCQNRTHPLMLYLDSGRVGVEMWRDDVRRLAEYLTGIVDTVPEAPYNGPMRGEGPYDNLV